MSHIEQEIPFTTTELREAPTSTVQNELRAALGMLRRRARIILAGAAVGLVLAAIYAFTATPLYKATAQVSIDPKRLSVLEMPDERRKREEPAFDPARADSQAEAIKSDGVARVVVKNLDLVNDPEFNGEAPSVVSSMISSVLSYILPARTRTAAEKETETVAAVLKKQSVQRVENTFVIGVDMLSEVPDKAARIANEFATVFLQQQLDVSSETTKRASDWLKQRLTELSANVIKADTAVIEFRRKNNIATADGKSIEDQALSSMSDKLTQISAATAEAKARLDQIAAARNSAVPDFSVTDALRNEVITKLRQQYLDNSQRAANFAARYGQLHGAVLKLNSENANIVSSIKDEMGRIEEAYRSDYQVARKREEAVRAGLDEQFLKTVRVGQFQVQLQELEATARAARQNYDETMQRFLQATQKQTFPIGDARVLSSATAPTKKHSPKRGLLMAIGAFAGTMLGFGLALGAELVDSKIRTRRELEQATGVDCLGVIPLISMKPKGTSTFQETGAAPGRKGLPWDYVVKAPFSVGAEAIRGIKIAADRANNGRGARVIGIISALPGEGKSSISANLAHLIAHSGSRVLLIDGDMRNPELSRVLTPKAQAGLPNILVGRVARQSVTYSETSIPLDFIPARTTLKLQHTHEILRSPAMSDMLAECRAQYAYVIVDLPPLVPVVDVKAAGHLLDGFALVVAWGETPRDVVTDALNGVPWIWERIFGSVLNKAELARLKQYGEFSGYYYNKNYFKS